MTRQYSAEEQAALREIFGVDPDSGPAQFATGRHWPEQLEREAGVEEKRIPKLRLVAAALRREIAAEALTSGSSS